VAVLVAVLLSGGVLLGSAAYAVDLGVLYAARDQVLNAAASAAMAMAKECTRPDGDCRNRAVMNALLAGNGNGGKTVVPGAGAVCGHNLGVSGALPTCAADTGGSASHCLPHSSNGLSWVEVRAVLPQKDEATVYPPSFAGSVVPGYSGTSIGACARVEWGPPAAQESDVPDGRYAAFSISKCAFDHLTGGMATGTKFKSPADVGLGTVITLRDWDEHGGKCEDHDLIYLNDKFGCLNHVHYLDHVDGHLNDKDHKTKPDNLNACKDLLNEKLNATGERPYLLLPIYQSIDNINDTGEADVHNLLGIAAFRVTGYRFDSERSPSNCNSTDKDVRCLRGYFVWTTLIDGTKPATNWNGGTLGVSVLRTAG
jgi:hypothetical protein